MSRDVSEKQINKWFPGLMKKLGFIQTEFTTKLENGLTRSNQFEKGNIIISQLSRSIMIFSNGKRIYRIYIGSNEHYKEFKEYMNRFN